MTGTLQVATSGTVSGLQNNQQVNAVAAALATANQGGTAPSTASTGLAATAGVFWHDTVNNLLLLRNQADSGWICLAAVDETNGRLVFSEPNYLSGLTLSNDGTSPNTVVDVAPGWAMDSGNVQPMILPSAITKTTSGTFAAGSGNAGLDTGSVAANTWYHLHLIWGPGKSSDVLLSTSATAPTMPSGYTLHRRVGSIKTDGSSHILAFSQNGDEFLWAQPPQDLLAACSTSATLATLSTPLGAKTNALVTTVLSSVTATTGTYLSSPDVSNISAFPSNETVLATGTNNAQGFGSVRTNTSSQVRVISSGTGATLTIGTLGWIDTRGKQG